jgi:DNA-directed RNA polymerase specialized sigma24 family protein
VHCIWRRPSLDRPQIDLETHERLVAWARWARGKYLPSCLKVACGSLESQYLPAAGDVFLTATEALERSVKAQERLSRGDEWQTERAVSSLPDKPRTCLRMHYVGYRRIPQIQRRKMLGVTETDYWVLLLRASQMLKNRLTP